FPGDSRNLTRWHWEVMRWVNKCMMLYVALSPHLPSAALRAVRDAITPPTKPLSIPRPAPGDGEEDFSFVGLDDIQSILWHSLERINSRIESAVEAVVITPEFNWAAGVSEEELDALRRSGRVKLLY